MQLMGTLHEADENAKSKVRKGPDFPTDAQPADLFTLISGGQEIPYIRKASGWFRLLLDSENIDGGTY